MLWLCLHFTGLPLEVYTRAGEEADARLLAVAERHAVLCASRSAAALGVRPGMSSGTAQALVAGLQLLERAPEREHAALLALADWAWRFTSRLSVEPPARLLLELGASLRLFGGLAALLATLESELRARGHHAHCGLAPTPLGAELLARARPCSAAALPAWCADGCDLAAFHALLDSLPLAALEAPGQQQLAMQRMGLARLGELFALPRAALGRRFGKAFLGYVLRLRGEAPDPRRAYRPRERFESTLHFLEPVEDSAMLLFPMRRLLEELGQFLARRQHYCQRLAWQLGCPHAPALSMEVSCSLEQHRAAALFELTRLALERTRPVAPVGSLTLRCIESAPLRGQGTDLFDAHAAGGAEAERLLLDRLRLRLGPEALYGLRAVDSPLPEAACREVREPPAPGGEPPALSPWAQRPCWLLQAPAPLGGTAQAPDWNGPLVLLSGPERIDTHWWAEPRRRDYYVARHADGVTAWVFRERASGRWFLQGVFG